MAKGVPSCKDLTGQRFGRLTAIQRVGTSKNGAALWQTRCECGLEKNLSRTQLRDAKPRCECQKKEALRDRRERARLRCIEYRKRKAVEEGRVYRPRVPMLFVSGHKRCTSCKAIKPLGAFHKNGNKRFKDGYGNECKECKRIERHKRYEKTYIKSLAPRKAPGRKPSILSVEEVEKRRNKRRKDARMWYAANRERILLRFKERDRNISDSLSDSYIKKMVTKGTSLKYKDIPKDLIEVWRLKITLHRELKKRKEAVKCTTLKESTI